MQTQMTRLPTVDGPKTDSGEWQTVDNALKRFGYQQDALIEVLHIAQQAFGYLPETVLMHISRQLKLPPSWVFGVAYTLFGAAVVAAWFLVPPKSRRAKTD